MSKNFYITTPIYYVTDAPHIGHLYTTTAADISSRYHRWIGDSVWFLTGTDEHGQKIAKKAKEQDLEPQALADKVVVRYQEAWKVFGITYDDFIRTTEERHKKVVHEYIQTLMKTGDIYLGSYEGWYCVPDEMYWTETQLKDGNCPDCGRPVEKLREESYFFKLSAYVEKLKKHIEQNPSFIQPESRKNEVLGFLNQEVRDISISRTTITWGIPMPKDPKATKNHVVYVWFDALTNYISALSPSKYSQFWKEAVHIVGKDILRFHAVYWPAFLMALKLPLPKQIIAHGWLTDANRKISKSLGNVIDPIQLAQKYGVDGLRFFLFKEFIFGLDGEYTEKTLIQRINSDLANNYGNCVHRVCSMIGKYFGEEALENTSLKTESDLTKICKQSIPDYHTAMQGFLYHKALEAVGKIVDQTNGYIENNAPWTLAKNQKMDELKSVLIHCWEALRIASELYQPFIPETAKKALGFLGVTDTSYQAAEWGKHPGKIKVQKSSALYARIEAPENP